MIIRYTLPLHEKDYFNNVFKILEKHLDDNFVITVDPLTAENPKRGTLEPVPGRINILLGMWDEYDSKFHRELYDKYDFIFNQYIIGEEEREYDHLFSLPLGYNGNIIEENEHIQPLVSVSERPVDLFFSGHMSSKQRYESMINNITYFQENKTYEKHNFDFNVTTGFMRGFKGKEYYKKLYNSKVVFCPPGNISNETYRFYEAMMCGCVIISPTLPDTEIYRDVPVIQVEDFNNNAAKVASDLLEDKVSLTYLQNKNIEFWKTRYSYNSVADYILTKIKL